MSIKSQTNNMRRLAVLFNFNLCNIHGKKECGPNGSKQVFLNVGKVFLRALARDLGLHDVTVSSNAGGIGVRTGLQGRRFVSLSNQRVAGENQGYFSFLCGRCLLLCL